MMAARTANDLVGIIRIAANRKPNSVRLRNLRSRADCYGVTTIPLASPSLARSSDRPGGHGRAVLSASLFGLAPCGVWPATRVTTSAVRSYRTFSPLPRRSSRCEHRERRRAVCFLCHFPSSRPDRVLPGTLPCGVRTFLPPSRLSALRRAAVWFAATLHSNVGRMAGRAGQAGWEERVHSFLPFLPFQPQVIRLSPAKSGTARASCTNYCAACR